MAAPLLPGQFTNVALTATANVQADTSPGGTISVVLPTMAGNPPQRGNDVRKRYYLLPRGAPVKILGGTTQYQPLDALGRPAGPAQQWVQIQIASPVQAVLIDDAPGAQNVPKLLSAGTVLWARAFTGTTNNFTAKALPTAGPAHPQPTPEVRYVPVPTPPAGISVWAALGIAAASGALAVWGGKRAYPRSAALGR